MEEGDGLPPERHDGTILFTKVLLWVLFGFAVFLTLTLGVLTVHLLFVDKSPDHTSKTIMPVVFAGFLVVSFFLFKRASASKNAHREVHVARETWAGRNPRSAQFAKILVAIYVLLMILYKLRIFRPFD